MAYPDKLNAGMFTEGKPWKRIHEDGNIQIASFQVPMIYQGYVERIIWIRPPWSHQIADGKELIHVGNLKNSESVASDSVAPYFGHSYGSTPKLVNTQSFVLDVFNIREENARGRNFADLKLDPAHTLLDIDLDYFSTSNPQRLGLKKDLGLSEEAIARLGKVFSDSSYDFTDVNLPREIIRLIKPSRSNDPKIVEFSRRDQIYYHTCLKYFMTPKYLHVSERFFLRKLRWCRKAFTGSRSEIKKILLEAREFLKQRLLKINIKSTSKDRSKNKGELFHYLNLILNLPNHISSQLTMVEMREELEKFFHDCGLSKDNHHPVMTTIARSESDGHTPKQLREFIEVQVFIMMHNSFVKRVGNAKKVSYFDAY